LSSATATATAVAAGAAGAAREEPPKATEDPLSNPLFRKHEKEKGEKKRQGRGREENISGETAKPISLSSAADGISSLLLSFPPFILL